jgi:hypothetical protein
MNETVSITAFKELQALYQQQTKELLAVKYELFQLVRMLFGMRRERVEIDNNLIENAIRPLALGRKNYLFSGSHDAAQRAAMLYSFFASCKTMELNPWEWLRDVLQQVGNHPTNRIEELLPGNFKTGQ